MKERVLVCKATELRPGGRKIICVGKRSIGIFNVKGRYHALLNVCPHTGAKLCHGVICGTNRTVDLAREGYRYHHEREGEILRCGWHGWEFDIATGRCLSDKNVCAKTYAVEVEGENIYVLA